MGFAGSAAWFEPPRVHAYWRVPFERLSIDRFGMDCFPRPALYEDRN
jgi:hypothetical protein